MGYQMSSLLVGTATKMCKFGGHLSARLLVRGFVGLHRENYILGGIEMECLRFLEMPYHPSENKWK